MTFAAACRAGSIARPMSIIGHLTRVGQRGGGGSRWDNGTGAKGNSPRLMHVCPKAEHQAYPFTASMARSLLCGSNGPMG
jgi:hypothetical protein